MMSSCSNELVEPGHHRSQSGRNLRLEYVDMKISVVKVTLSWLLGILSLYFSAPDTADSVVGMFAGPSWSWSSDVALPVNSQISTGTKMSEATKSVMHKIEELLLCNKRNRCEIP